MHKNDLVQELAKRMGCEKKLAAEQIDTLLDIIEEHVSYGEDVSIAGFGKFYARQKPARKARNPRTGEEIEIEAHTAFDFKPARRLAEKFRKADLS